METATKQLIWNNDAQRYYFDLGEGRTLWVDGDAFIEAVHDAKKAYLEERFPHTSLDEISGVLVEEIYDEAKDELLDPDLWENNALEVPAGQKLEDVPHFYQHDAWIITRES